MLIIFSINPPTVYFVKTPKILRNVVTTIEVFSSSWSEKQTKWYLQFIIHGHFHKIFPPLTINIIFKALTGRKREIKQWFEYFIRATGRCWLSVRFVQSSSALCWTEVKQHRDSQDGLHPVLIRTSALCENTDPTQRFSSGTREHRLHLMETKAHLWFEPTVSKTRCQHIYLLFHVSKIGTVHIDEHVKKPDYRLISICNPLAGWCHTQILKYTEPHNMQVLQQQTTRRCE